MYTMWYTVSSTLVFHSKHRQCACVQLICIDTPGTEACWTSGEDDDGAAAGGGGGAGAGEGGACTGEGGACVGGGVATEEGRWACAGKGGACAGGGTGEWVAAGPGTGDSIPI